MKNRKGRKRRDERIRLHRELIRKTWKHCPVLPTPRPPVANNSEPPVVVTGPFVTPAPTTTAEVLDRAARVADELNELAELYRAEGYAPLNKHLRRLVRVTADGATRHQEGR